MNAWGVQNHIKHSAPDYAIRDMYFAADLFSTSCFFCVISLSGDCAADMTRPLLSELCCVLWKVRWALKHHGVKYRITPYTP